MVRVYRDGQLIRENGRVVAEAKAPRKPARPPLGGLGRSALRLRALIAGEMPAFPVTFPGIRLIGVLGRIARRNPGSPADLRFIGPKWRVVFTERVAARESRFGMTRPVAGYPSAPNMHMRITVPDEATLLYRDLPEFIATRYQDARNNAAAELRDKLARRRAMRKNAMHRGWSEAEKTVRRAQAIIDGTVAFPAPIAFHVDDSGEVRPLHLS